MSFGAPRCDNDTFFVILSKSFVTLFCNVSLFHRKKIASELFSLASMQAPFAKKGFFFFLFAVHVCYNACLLCKRIKGNACFLLLLTAM
jgi:hypothetical protein